MLQRLLSICNTIPRYSQPRSSFRPLATRSFFPRHYFSNTSQDGTKGYAVYFYNFDPDDPHLTNCCIDKAFLNKDEALKYAKQFAPDDTTRYCVKTEPLWEIPAISDRNFIEGQGTDAEVPDSEFITDFCRDNGLEKWLSNMRYNQSSQNIVFHRAILPDAHLTNAYNAIAISEITLEQSKNSEMSMGNKADGQQQQPNDDNTKSKSKFKFTENDVEDVSVIDCDNYYLIDSDVKQIQSILHITTFDLFYLHQTTIHKIARSKEG